MTAIRRLAMSCVKGLKQIPLESVVPIIFSSYNLRDVERKAEQEKKYKSHLRKKNDTSQKYKIV